MAFWETLWTIWRAFGCPSVACISCYVLRCLMSNHWFGCHRALQPSAIFFLWPICHVETLLCLCCFNQIWSRPNVGDLSYDRTTNFVPSSWEMFLAIYLWFGGSSFNPFLNWRDMYCPTLKIYYHYLKFGWYFCFLNHMSQKASVHKFLALWMV